MFTSRRPLIRRYKILTREKSRKLFCFYVCTIRCCCWCCWLRARATAEEREKRGIRTCWTSCLRMPFFPGAPCEGPSSSSGSKARQNLIDSSAAEAVTSVWPSGERQACKIRPACAWSKPATRVNPGAHSLIAFEDWPCVDTISLLRTLQTRAETGESVAIVERSDPSCVFQVFMHLSWEPPPVASRPPFRHGHHARALTAARCSASVCLAAAWPASQMCTRFALLPAANCSPSGHQAMLQISSR